MPATPIYALPYPASSDPADVPLDVQRLADRLELVFPGKELGYVQFTSTVTITGTTSGTATPVATAPAITFDGSTAVLIDFYACTVNPGTGTMQFALFDGSTALGLLDYLTGNIFWPVMSQRRLTPTAGAHTYSIRAWNSVAGGTVTAGDGSPGGFMPGFIRITRA